MSGVLDPQGIIGKAQLVILTDALVIMLVIVIPVIILTLAFAWWFRASNTRARYRPDWQYSGRVEFVTWSIPALVILFLAGLTWVSTHELDPPRPIASANPPLEIQVIALDWKWLFIYPEQGIASINQLVVPVDTPLRFRITSSDVMNSFFIPQLGSQIYAMPRMENVLYLQADAPGTYGGLSANYSGGGFSKMRFAVYAVDAADFDSWVETTKRGTLVLDAITFAQIAPPSTLSRPLAFAAVAPGMYDAVLANGRALAPYSPAGR
ncbi:ubiquinol oxidase subunit II [Povalibacter sp.]|uniref:ubiquinol oxidase subunit II n=1 Tax=Povalibacter sp. TaxID=1962978 RepID=UPI002F417F01